MCVNWFAFAPRDSSGLPAPRASHTLPLMGQGASCEGLTPEVRAAPLWIHGKFNQNNAHSSRACVIPLPDRSRCPVRGERGAPRRTEETGIQHPCDPGKESFASDP
ncbi:hypothetical protein AAFF_G00217820 [Aldrovandia affinis]|uniref:Uncharacterized protein n=1 Tax=Aldrovandia affinis TaxID=143900 RepID=A0AAD7WUP9_9TELE|nr:hypothetical protein AAFF_G00217820 [Aldrovandia affinis]